MIYGVFPNLIFILSVLGIAILFINRLPEVERANLPDEPKQFPEHIKNLTQKGLPILIVSKIIIFPKYLIKRLWVFILEAKDLKPAGNAGHKLKKIISQIGSEISKIKPHRHALNGIDPEQEILKKIKKEPKNLSLYYELANYYLKIKKIGDAKDVFLYLTNHDPANGEYQSMLAYTYFLSRDWKRSIQYYEKAISLDSGHAKRYYNLGLSLDNDGRVLDARLAFQKAANMEPENIKYQTSLEKIRQKINPEKSTVISTGSESDLDIVDTDNHP